MALIVDDCIVNTVCCSAALQSTGPEPTRMSRLTLGTQAGLPTAVPAGGAKHSSIELKRPGSCNLRWHLHFLTKFCRFRFDGAWSICTCAGSIQRQHFRSKQLQRQQREQQWRRNILRTRRQDRFGIQRKQHLRSLVEWRKQRVRCEQHLRTGFWTLAKRFKRDGGCSAACRDLDQPARPLALLRVPKAGAAHAEAGSPCSTHR